MTSKRPLVIPAAALVLAAAVVPARAFLWWRSRLESAWAARPVVVDGDDSGWDDSTAYEDSGLSLQARNDGTTLWLLVTARTEAARDQLDGAAKQDLTVWFLAPDGKTARWGVRLPLRRDGPDAAPEFAAGRDGGSRDLPEGFASKRGTVGRRPVWEMSLPLSSVAPDADGRVDLDFAVTGEPARPRRRARAERGPEERESGESGESGEGGGWEGSAGGVRRMRGGRGRRGEGTPAPDVPEPLRLSLSLRLAAPSR